MHVVAAVAAAAATVAVPAGVLVLDAALRSSTEAHCPSLTSLFGFTIISHSRAHSRPDPYFAKWARAGAAITLSRGCSAAESPLVVHAYLDHSHTFSLAPTLTLSTEQQRCISLSRPRGTYSGAAAAIVFLCCDCTRPSSWLAMITGGAIAPRSLISALLVDNADAGQNAASLSATGD